MSIYIHVNVLNCRLAAFRVIMVLTKMRSNNKTLEREANRRYSSFTEGKFIFDKLSAHLDGYNADKVISISEDATRATYILCGI